MDAKAAQVLNQTEAAALLRVSPRTLYNWHRKGTLRGFRGAGGTRGKLLYDAEKVRERMGAK